MINSKRLGLAGGILWGLSVFVMTLASIFFGYGTEWLTILGGVYPGYTITFMGSVVGLVYGFIDGFVGLYLLGWLYNKLDI